MEKRRSSLNKNIQVRMWKVLSVQISGALQNIICATQEYTNENVESVVCADKWSTSEYDLCNT
jgi:hypothetical protein